MIGIIDYGAGNLHSVQNALAFLGAESVVSGKPDVLFKADKIILPGVGAFGDAMSALRRSGLSGAIREIVRRGTPLLGVCLGLQLLFSESQESPGVPGLGLLPGTFRKIPKQDGLKIPHIGWNSLEIKKPSQILRDLGPDPYVYFVHSYCLEAKNPQDVSAYTTYGARFAVAAERDNLFAVQFHPEKSGETGLKILKNFLEL